jgi:hypothetical protein
LRKELFGLETVPDVKEYAIDPWMNQVKNDAHTTHE